MRERSKRMLPFSKPRSTRGELPGAQVKAWMIKREPERESFATAFKCSGLGKGDVVVFRMM